MKTFGPSRFRGITSDNTGNTSLVRKLVQKNYPWITILPDPCHRLNLLCKDIGKIEAFKPVSNFILRGCKEDQLGSWCRDASHFWNCRPCSTRDTGITEHPVISKARGGLREETQASSSTADCGKAGAAPISYPVSVSRPVLPPISVNVLKLMYIYSSLLKKYKELSSSFESPVMLRLISRRHGNSSKFLEASSRLVRLGSGLCMLLQSPSSSITRPFLNYAKIKSSLSRMSTISFSILLMPPTFYATSNNSQPYLHQSPSQSNASNLLTRPLRMFIYFGSPLLLLSITCYLAKAPKLESRKKYDLP